MGATDALQGNLGVLQVFLRACCGIEETIQIELHAPMQAGSCECGHCVALLVQQLLLAAFHRVPFRMMAFPYGQQQLGCLMRSLLLAVLLQSTTALKAMCTTRRGVGTPCMCFPRGGAQKGGMPGLVPCCCRTKVILDQLTTCGWPLRAIVSTKHAVSMRPRAPGTARVYPKVG